MPAIQTTDWLALKARVDSLTLDTPIAAYEPGEIVTPPKDAAGPLPFILLADVPNDPDRVGISGGANGKVDHIRSGVLMLTLQWPIARAITHARLKELAGQVAEHFPAGTCMTFGASRLRVTQDSAPMQPYVDGAYRVAVVRVFWSSI